jgi:hypothetical protein
VKAEVEKFDVIPLIYEYPPKKKGISHGHVGFLEDNI